MELAERNTRRVYRFFEALNRGDREAIADTYATDGYLWTMGNTLISGKFSRDQILAAVDGVFDVFPEGLHFDINGITAQGERVAVEATSEGMHASGTVYSNSYHFLFTFRDGELIELKEYLDTERVTDILCAGKRPEQKN